MEYVEMRFGKQTKTIITFLQMPIMMLMCGNLLYVLCIFISSALGFKENFVIFGITLSGLHLAMIFTGVVVILYTSIGGLWAVIVTDTVQFLIVMIASVLLAIFSFVAFKNGGSFIANFQAYVANPPVEGYFRPFNSLQPLSFTLAWITLQIFSQSGYLPMIQRCACVSTERDAQKSCWLSVVFFVICPLIWLFPVFILRNQLPDMAALWPHIKNPTEASYVTIALQLLPNGMIGLVISAILAASISTLAGNFNLVSVIFTNDIYQKIFAPEATHQKLMLVGKIVSVLIGVLTIVIGIMLSGFSDAFRTTFTIVSHTSIALALPMALGMLFKRIPWWTGIVAMFACFTTTLSIEFLTPVISKYSDLSIWVYMQNNLFVCNVFSSILINLIVFGVSMVFYKPGNLAKGANKLFALLQKPVSEDIDHEPVVVPDLKAYRVVAIALLIFGVPLSLCKIFKMTEDVQFINLYAGLAFLSLSFIIFWLTSKRFSPFKIVRQQKI
jgi:Na+/proline symporter